ncbi:MAG: NAD(P)/FAD-dependent oxidoreductase [Deltaproteobacteria bacterium]|nr:NAD(P)/FAD-dependent oxidoreductase [Deltaproteobacteria bacterium]
MNQTYDVIVIGGGHNGLTLALYMAAAKLKVLVLERRHEFGGGLSTEEVTIPGYYHNLHSNFHGIMPFFPPYNDFNLARRGVRYILPEADIGMPLKDGRALILYSDDRRAADSIAAFSERDAEEFLEVRRRLAFHSAEVLGGAFSPPAVSPRQRLFLEEEYGRIFGDDVLDHTAAEWVERHFENPHVRALLLYHMAICGFDVRLPRLAALGIGYLAYLTNWQLCVGGSHHLAHAMGGELLAQGGELLESRGVKQILVESNRAVGVVTVDGTEFRARDAVVSSVDPHQTFLDFLPREALDPTFRKKVEAIRYGHGDVLFGAHVALKEPPHHIASAGHPDIDRTWNLNIGYETPEDLYEHYEEIDRGELPKRPRLNAGVNTLFDPSQAPHGRHTALIWQFAPFEIGERGGAAWDSLGDDYARACVDAWREYAPNMGGDNVLAVHPYTPYDIARKMVNMRRGGFHVAAISHDQAAENRPIPELSGFRAPVTGLYLCGASQHVHGGILSSPGYNCAQVLAEDLGVFDKLPFKSKPWWPAVERWREKMAKIE